ncbi:class I SAM-dependent methyltransferase [bacterium]
MIDNNTDKISETIDSVVQALDGEDSALYPYLPYLLQDLWEIGSSAVAVQDLIQKQCLDRCTDFRVLDLGCGKGAISIPLAKKFEFQVAGIDAMPAFIQEAREWADKLQVSHLCRFEVGDIRNDLEAFKEYHLAILGSIGPVLGSVEQTLNRVKPCLTLDGYVILDDGYIPEGSFLHADHYLTDMEIKAQIQNAGFNILEEQIFDKAYIRSSDREIYEAIENRAKELMEIHPEKRELFQDYLKTQARENDILENEIVCVTWLLKRI